jgi:small GTP-binding protein
VSRVVYDGSLYDAAMNATVMVMTAIRPGAIAIVQLQGSGVIAVLRRLLQRDTKLSPGSLQVIRIPQIDDAMIARLDETVWQLMPHGGPSVVKKLVQACVDAGASVMPSPDARALYPEADSAIEADMLAAIAQAASPAAVDRLLAQPGRWRAWWASGSMRGSVDQIHPWDQLLHPPTVVVIGRPNVGKSTLLNALAGRAVSLVADLPGTTRDWVGGFVELPWRGSHVAVRWLDTPGFRDTDDLAERSAIAAARQVLREADVLIAMRDFDNDWPDGADLPRSPHLHVVNKCDSPERITQAPGLAPHPHRVIPLSADTGAGMPELISEVIGCLGLETVQDEDRWPFSQTLRADGDLSDYLSSDNR